MTGLRDIFERLDRPRVLLIGDTILDVYTYGKALGLSAETPTIVAAKGEVMHSLGGAALVCRNLLELGAGVHFVTLAGSDDDAAHIASLSSPKLELLLIKENERRTTVKHRFWVDGYKLFQLDTRDDRPISDETEEQILALVEKRLSAATAVILSDYRHGLLSPKLVARLLPVLHRSGKPIFVDSQVSQKESNHRQYRGDAIMCLNLKEARCIDPNFVPSDEAKHFSALQCELGTDRIVIKLGDQGALMLNRGRLLRAPVPRVAVVDTTGAGDAFLAAFCLAGLDDPEAALNLANLWAGLSVKIHGPSPPRKGDLRDAIAARELAQRP